MTAESFTNRAFMDQTWKMYLDEFPRGDVFQLRKPPLQSVTSIKYTTYDGSSDTTQTFSSDKYRVDTDSVVGRVALKDGEDWPDPSDPLASLNPVEIEFDAGYGPNPGDFPEDIRQAIRQLTAHYYENREMVVIGTITNEIPMTVASLLWNKRIKLF